ncbi:Dbl homology (DH) domain and Pleckstrin homology domain and Pleckstrin homology-like domain-containing protein [Strongyloides ratti]|uniref:Dbl homology (DH) domain and Pleckstrin homology domain and Pleckstrin homology-like domain-containing protein n=1 Tax=Strongyloides ratti TaxID=34506 RepID=A0A090LRU0_STRRB|nr:Dbl homology (DH) domain and Pleckstrin homology domain and Pleckstrin homology-like domain-containing protein [Strongyloides ratti]CEF70296.1 Dbl homology (DH) domain and Pleckstrin homology domain and Pleckstrin homology-like domain-containing protein [Strongyloides ratti]
MCDKEDDSLTDYDNGYSDVDSTLMTSSNLSNSYLQLSSKSNISNNSQKISSLYYLNFYDNHIKPYRILSATESQETIAKMTSQKKELTKNWRSKSKPINDRRKYSKEDTKYNKKEVLLSRSVTYHNSFNHPTSISNLINIKKGFKRFDFSSIHSSSLLSNLLSRNYFSTMPSKECSIKYWLTTPNSTRRPSLMVDDDVISNPSSGNRNSTISSSNSDDIENGHRNSVLTTTSGYQSDRSQVPSTSKEPSFIVDSSIIHFLKSRPIFKVEESISYLKRQEILNSSNVSKKYRVIIELLDTEISYLNDLEDVLQGYATFLSNHEEDIEISAETTFTIFHTLEKVYEFSKKLYHDLDNSNMDTIKISKIFINLSGGFQCYSDYCSEYQKTLNLLGKLKENLTFLNGLNFCQNLLKHSLPLDTYLLKPVQRILKYHLFIESLLKCTSNEIVNDNNEIEKQYIMDALNVMNNEATKINETQKKAEYEERLKELHTMFVNCSLEEGLDFTHCGRLLLDGSFKILNSKQKRSLFLFERMLLVTKERNECFVCKDCIITADLMLNELIVDNPLAFQVSSFQNPKDNFIFVAENKKVKSDWMKKIKETIFNHYAKDIPQKSKDLLMNMTSNIMDQYSDDKIDQPLPSYHHVSRKSIASLLQNKNPKNKEKRRKSIGVIGEDNNINHGNIISDHQPNIVINIGKSGSQVDTQSRGISRDNNIVLHRDPEKVKRIYINRSQMIERLMHPKRALSNSGKKKSHHSSNNIQFMDDDDNEPIWRYNTSPQNSTNDVWEKINPNGSSSINDDFFDEFSSDDSPTLHENSHFSNQILFDKMLEEEYTKNRSSYLNPHDSGVFFENISLESIPNSSPSSGNKHRRTSQVAEQVRRVKESRNYEKIINETFNKNQKINETLSTK